MEYTGKLYGKIRNKYFDTGFTSEDYDKLQEENSELQKQVLNMPVVSNNEVAACDIKSVKHCYFSNKFGCDKCNAVRE